MKKLIITLLFFMSFNFLIAQSKDTLITYQNIITPNNDGINDEFNIYQFNISSKYFE